MKTSKANERGALIEKHLNWAKRVALALYRKIGPPEHLRDDFISSAYLGLVEAARPWDPKRQENFKKFAIYRITGEIYNFIPRSVGLSYKAYKELGVLREQCKNQDTSGTLNDLITFLGIQDFDIKPLPNPEEACIRLETRKQVAGLVSNLPPRLGKTVKLRYFKNKTPAEVAQARNRSIVTISKQHKEALGHLRKMISYRMPELQNIAA